MNAQVKAIGATEGFKFTEYEGNEYALKVLTAEITSLDKRIASAKRTLDFYTQKGNAYEVAKQSRLIEWRLARKLDLEAVIKTLTA
jgi:hypothetical protein